MRSDDRILRRARNNAYSLLRSRPRSEAEIRARLKLKGYGPSVIEDTVGFLKRCGEIDDAKFARLWVESRMRFNPMGKMVLRRELKEKGISDSIIEATLAEKDADYDEYKVAFSMAKEKFGRLAKIESKKALKRLHDFLARRGFAYDIIQRIIDGIIDENG
ncbi:MAG: recombination regulator RecX [Candidatus Omnitrophica bacterium]|nr:recombination regulator RecX [Candidatus Omnitrophota bacterium]